MLDGKIRAEWHPLNKVVIHRPGMEMFFGLLEPTSSLYERAFSRIGARREHEMLELILRNVFNVEVIKLKHAIIEAANTKPAIKKVLIDLARDTLEFGGDSKASDLAIKEFENNIKYLDTAHFFNILMVNPYIHLQSSDSGRTDVQLNITKRQPLANLYFMRDQQFVTEKGIVLCRMAKPARRNEPKITKFLWETVMGLDVIHEMQDPAMIEGGEFIPMGKFALVGIGDRTNQAAIDQLLSLGLDYEEIGVVHQPMHPAVASNKPDTMINMHLDTYFNVASRSVVVGCETLIKNAQIDLYKNEGMGKFVKTKTKINLYDYIKKKGFYVINLTSLEQMCYATNFLCIKDGVILAVECERNIKNVLENLTQKAEAEPKRYGKLLALAKKEYEHLKHEGQFFPHKKELYHHDIDAYPINIPNLTGGYGAAHCMTCALSRG